MELPNPPLVTCKRRHFAVRCRVDLIQYIAEESRRLGCSQGVFIELLLVEYRRGMFQIDLADVYDYSLELAKVGLSVPVLRRP